MRKATAVVHKLTSLGLGVSRVRQAVRGKIWPMALYAAATSHAPKDACASLQGAIADALLGSGVSVRSPEMVLAFGGRGMHTVEAELVRVRLLSMRR
eukprot:10443552-Alexandrium_andersonii.AAC.1